MSKAYRKFVGHKVQIDMLHGETIEGIIHSMTEKSAWLLTDGEDIFVSMNSVVEMREL